MIKLAYIAVALCLTSPARAQDLSDQFYKHYAGMRSIRCTFEGSYGINGRLVASKGLGYALDLPTRTIVSNNKFVWNAEKNSKTVIVNAYSPNSNEMSLEKIFFILFNVYSRQQVNSPNNARVVKLYPPGPSAIIGGVSEVYVTLDAKLKIIKITVSQDGSPTTWVIKNVVKNARIPVSTFVYTVPKGWTLIDLTK